jgi:hypothetical protein
MFTAKIKRKESGILLYGITPPKEHTAPDKVLAVAERVVNALSGFDLDGLVVYDVQDESARTTEERPFPFVNALDPFEFASECLQPRRIVCMAGWTKSQSLSSCICGAPLS